MINLVRPPWVQERAYTVFVDAAHKACNGEGCVDCDGSGLQGAVQQVQRYAVVLTPDVDSAAYAAHFKTLRKSLGLTLADAAERLGGLTASDVYSLEQSLLIPVQGWRIVFETLASRVNPSNDNDILRKPTN